jgi:anthranilate synthase/aminodeoxychorismate synthase-like glutamine amidotransferase
MLIENAADTAAPTEGMKLLLIDNYDSFTYNLAQIFGELGAEVLVKRNDAIGPAEIRKFVPERICISPGPGRPRDAGISCDVIREFGPRIPLLGVCLGHQCIGEVFGGEIVRAPKLMHGKTSAISHHGSGVFENMSQPFAATRYHSLVVKRDSLPDSLFITAESDDSEIMGLQHCEFPIHGVQFHPESILTGEGRKLLANFLNLSSRA